MLSGCACMFVGTQIAKELPHDKTNKMTGASSKLRSALASTQSDQGLRCPHGETLGPYLPVERTVKTLIRLGAHVILLVLSCGS